MYEVVGIKFDSSNRLYYFEVNGQNVNKGDNVVVETEKGLQFGKVQTQKKNVEEQEVSFPLKKIVRIATNDDVSNNINNQQLAEKALEDARNYAKKLNLSMNF